MRRYALPLLFLVSCASAQEAGERVDATRAPFTSVHATLLDFELDGTLVADTEDLRTLRRQIEAQILFTVGPLNAEQLGRAARPAPGVVRSARRVIPAPPPPPPPPPPPDPRALAPRSGRACTRSGGARAPPATRACPRLHPIPRPRPRPPVPNPHPAPAAYAVTYHAKLPVAWGGATKPTTYSFTLPAKTRADRSARLRDEIRRDVRGSRPWAPSTPAACFSSTAPRSPAACWRPTTSRPSGDRDGLRAEHAGEVRPSTIACGATTRSRSWRCSATSTRPRRPATKASPPTTTSCGACTSTSRELQPNDA